MDRGFGSVAAEDIDCCVHPGEERFVELVYPVEVYETYRRFFR